jgi:hypothetical protein
MGRALPRGMWRDRLDALKAERRDKRSAESETALRALLRERREAKEKHGLKPPEKA